MADPVGLFTEPQKSEIRRHLGYPEPSTGLNTGGPPYFQSFGQAGAHIGDRYTPAFYDFEYRLISVSQTANAMILGGESPYFAASVAFAQIAPTIVGTPTAGEILYVIVGGAVGSYILTAGDTVATISAGLAAAIAALPITPQQFVSSATPTYAFVSAIAAGPLGNAIPVLALGSPGVRLAVTDGAGGPCTTLRGGSEPPGPKYVDPNNGLTVCGHLPIIRYWETGIGQASSNFDTLKAGEYVADPNEYVKRRAAYVTACKDMAQTLAVQYYGAKSYRGERQLRRTY